MRFFLKIFFINYFFFNIEMTVSNCLELFQFFFLLFLRLGIQAWTGAQTSNFVYLYFMHPFMTVANTNGYYYFSKVIFFQDETTLRRCWWVYFFYTTVLFKMTAQRRWHDSRHRRRYCTIFFQLFLFLFVVF